VVIQSQIWIPDHFSTCLTIAEWGILGGDMLAFLIQSLANFHNTGRNDWCRQDNEFIKFGSDPADIRIKIWINAEVRIWIPDHVSLRLDALAEACSLWAQSTCLLCHRWKLWWCIELMVNILSVNYTDEVMLHWCCCCRCCHRIQMFPALISLPSLLM